jgi:hypothetical protein
MRAQRWALARFDLARPNASIWRLIAESSSSIWTSSTPSCCTSRSPKKGLDRASSRGLVSAATFAAESSECRLDGTAAASARLTFVRVRDILRMSCAAPLDMRAGMQLRLSLPLALDDGWTSDAKRIAPFSVRAVRYCTRWCFCLLRRPARQRLPCCLGAAYLRKSEVRAAGHARWVCVGGHPRKLAAFRYPDGVLTR